MRRTLDGTHPAVPLAMVCVAGFINAMFEDWLFAVGYYLSVFLWCLAFCMVDLTRQRVYAPNQFAPPTHPGSRESAWQGGFATSNREG
jgi:hypothetical protein